jgi:hypothetical protein
MSEGRRRQINKLCDTAHFVATDITSSDANQEMIPSEIMSTTLAAAFEVIRRHRLDHGLADPQSVLRRPDRSALDELSLDVGLTPIFLAPVDV